MRKVLQRNLAYLAAAWAAVYGSVALYWTITGDGFPYGEGNPDSIGLLHNLPADVGAPVFASVLVATSVMALFMAGGGRVPGVVRAVLTGFGGLVAVALLVVLPEVDLLAAVGYAPLLLVGAPFGWPDVDYSQVFVWPLLNQAFSVLGGFLVAGTVVSWRRRLRSGRRPAWAEPEAAARWGRWAVAVAMAVPLFYAATRYAWLLGIPFTVDREFLDELHDSGAVWSGTWLASFAVVGVILTLGLAQRWGEVFPRWMLGLAGRRVPVTLAVVPAAVVSALATSAGLSFYGSPEALEMLFDGEFIVLPSLLWPVWGVALAAATLAYYLRRTGREAAAAPSPAVAEPVAVR
ncbi:MAG TPA: hypothetical protein VIL37_02865 [Natronosporangium sp.]